MSRPRNQPFDTRGFLAVFLGRGGLGVGLALVVAVVSFLASQVVPGPIVVGGAVLAAVTLLFIVTRRRVQQAAEDIAEGAVDELS